MTTALMLNIAITLIIATQMSAITMQANSKGSNASNISSLEARANDLDRRTEFWTRASLTFVAATAIAAVLYGIAQGFLVKREKQFAQARTELSVAKDANLASELKEKDLKIAELTNENLKLQTLLLPRRVPVRPKDGDSVGMARLTEVVKYSQTLALIQSVPDFEAQNLAADISSALINSGWYTHIVEEDRTHIYPRMIKSGVSIVTLEPSRAFKSGPSKSGQAANTLVGLLSLNLAPPAGPESLGVRWEPEYKGHLTPVMKGISKLPDGVVLILVGMKPIEGILGGRKSAPTVNNSK